MAIKRIVIILIIVCVLLSFIIEISCLSQESKKSAGEFWNLLPDVSKVCLILGFEAGLDFCGLKILPILIKKEEENLITYEEAKKIMEVVDLYNYLDTNGPQIIRVIDDLYKDPANTHISISIIVDIAYQKLKGEDIEALLREARKEAFQNQ